MQVALKSSTKRCVCNIKSATTCCGIQLSSAYSKLCIYQQNTSVASLTPCLFVFGRWTDVNCKNTQNYEGRPVNLQIQPLKSMMSSTMWHYVLFKKKKVMFFGFKQSKPQEESRIMIGMRRKGVPAAGHKASGVDNGQSGNIHPAHEDHNLHSQRPYPFVPEPQNLPKSKVSVFKADSLIGRRALAYNPAQTKYVLSTGVIQVPSQNYCAKTKFTDSVSPFQVGKTVEDGCHQQKRLTNVCPFKHGDPGGRQIWSYRPSIK